MLLSQGDTIKADGTHQFLVYWNKENGQWYVSFVDLSDDVITSLVECLKDCEENYGGAKIIPSLSGEEKKENEKEDQHKSIYEARRHDA